MTTYDPERVVADLRALAEHTGGPEGSRRLAWTPEWLQARAMLRESLTTLPVEVDEDEAGNLWAVLRGERDDMLVVGSHLDSVPKGGWLDGALGVMSGLELLRIAGGRWHTTDHRRPRRLGRRGGCQVQSQSVRLGRQRRHARHRRAARA